ncbi:uncharacterized protein BDR25DRAFT_293190 [Lindgomyces ingoldianus]|uniref:Uncharacterized protein n=1 Tax=Lindgomyces ingoldianus TaxID=673940 RepID=A0ACB6QIF1_9PLEO|nr:uncharacterized protein BDR25DRAFT_293190 [Lindgomyces ingoldianus]KAF2466774.1 hypothetical protein BDR25DRAFT_293190 [Lindgomyces ingoldianus]
MPCGVVRRPRKFPGLLNRAQHCLYSTPAPKGDELGPIQQDGHQSFRVRRDGKRLPLPPLLDPVVLSERSRWEQPKARPSANKFTAFQRKLRESPYAHALASPVRQCRATHVFLPSALLISLHPRPHPETSEPWLLPVNLTTSIKHLGPPYRFLNRHLVATQLSQKQNWKAGMYPRLQDKLGSKASNMVWREDMPELILTLLRKNLVYKLRWHLQKSGGRMVVCDDAGSSALQAIEDVSCVLCFGSLKTSADEIQIQANGILEDVEYLAGYYAEGHKKALDPHQSRSISHHPPPWWRGPVVPRLQPRYQFPPLEFKTTGWRGTRVAVYGLFDLLGEDKGRELVEGTRFEGAQCVVMKRGHQNVPLQLQLMQLQAYLATPGP